jgi:hypothetical protein
MPVPWVWSINGLCKRAQLLHDEASEWTPVLLEGRSIGVFAGAVVEKDMSYPERVWYGFRSCLACGNVYADGTVMDWQKQDGKHEPVKMVECPTCGFRYGVGTFSGDVRVYPSRYLDAVHVPTGCLLVATSESLDKSFR